jgi:hypothetical protein
MLPTMCRSGRCQRSCVCERRPRQPSQACGTARLLAVAGPCRLRPVQQPAQPRRHAVAAHVQGAAAAAVWRDGQRGESHTFLICMQHVQWPTWHHVRGAGDPMSRADSVSSFLHRRAACSAASAPYSPAGAGGRPSPAAASVLSLTCRILQPAAGRSAASQQLRCAGL